MVTASVTNLDIVVNIIIIRLYIPIMYLLSSQSILLSMSLSITRSVCISVMLSARYIADNLLVRLTVIPERLSRLLPIVIM